MTNETMNLKTLIEKTPDAALLREMIVLPPKMVRNQTLIKTDTHLRSLQGLR